MAIVIRLATDADTAAIGRIYSPNVTESAVSFETTVPTEVAMRERIRRTMETLPWLVCASGCELLGYACASHHRVRPAYMWSTESSVYVDPGCRRRGVARGLYASLFATLTRQGYRNVYAGITLPNPASVRLHEAFGFEPVGVYRSAGYKLGAWHDVGWWQLRLNDVSGPPAPPVAVRELVDTPGFEAALAVGRAFVRAG